MYFTCFGAIVRHDRPATMFSDKEEVRVFFAKSGDRVKAMRQPLHRIESRIDKTQVNVHAFVKFSDHCP